MRLSFLSILLVAIFQNNEGFGSHQHESKEVSSHDHPVEDNFEQDVSESPAAAMDLNTREADVTELNELEDADMTNEGNEMQKKSPWRTGNIWGRRRRYTRRRWSLRVGFLYRRRQTPRPRRTPPRRVPPRKSGTLLQCYRRRYTKCIRFHGRRRRGSRQLSVFSFSASNRNCHVLRSNGC